MAVAEDSQVDPDSSSGGGDDAGVLCLPAGASAGFWCGLCLCVVPEQVNRVGE